MLPWNDQEEHQQLNVDYKVYIIPHSNFDKLERKQSKHLL